ncbi:uncharacterized protein TNCV_3181191 [Trichonephila clavipes]|nr:uncharacterized protein TNCV_3181191 [Trichonephila clavipes]
MASSVSIFTPADLWLWGYLKSRVYLSGPSSLSELKDAILREVSSIRPDMLHSAVAGFVTRLECLLPCGGGHVKHILDRLRPARNTGAYRNAEKPIHPAYAVQTSFVQLLGEGTLLTIKKVNYDTKTPIEHVYERKNRWNAGILTITNRSVSNSECGPVCDLKTVADVSKNGRCYLTTSIRSTKSHNPSPRPISGNKCATSEGQYCQITGFGAHGRHRNTNFESNCLQETQSCWPVCQKTSSLNSPHVCA